MGPLKIKVTITTPQEVEVGGDSQRPNRVLQYFSKVDLSHRVLIQYWLSVKGESVMLALVVLKETCASPKIQL